MKKPRALIYCRVSTTGQQEKGTSLESQAAACTQYAKEHGYTIAETIKEVHSGGDLEERPKLMAILQKIRTEDYNALIVYDPDRLTRGGINHWGVLLHEFEKYNVEFISITGDFENTPEGQLVKSVRSYASQLERFKIRERSMRGKRTKLQAGRMVAPSCELFGYRLNKETGKREIHETEAAIVARIFDWYASGKSIRNICMLLSEEGIPSPGANKKNYKNDCFRFVHDTASWATGSVFRILKNPAYIGKTYMSRYNSEISFKNGKRVYRQKLKPQKDWVTMPDDVTPAIITDKEFNAAQIRFAQNNGNNTRNEARPSLLRGMIFCRCGSKMHPAWSKPCPKRSRPGYIYYNYRCASSADGRACKLPGAQVNGTKLEEAVWLRIVDVLSNPEAVRLELQQRQEVSQIERDEVTHSLTATKKTLAKTTNEIAKLVERMGSVSDEVFDVVKAQIDTKSKERTRLVKLVEEAEARLKSFDTEVGLLASLEAYCDTFSEQLPRLDFNDKRTICEALGVRVVGNKGSTSLALAIPTDAALLENMSSNVSTVKMIETELATTRNYFTFALSL